ncbi:MAG TPA: hypothetical protein VIY27_02750 [Myxococcota bacterium]
MRYGSQDVVEVSDGYADAATRASGAPVGAGPGHVAYPLYGVGQVPPNGAAPGMASAATAIARLKWPFVGFILGAAAMGGAWFYFGHWLPLKKKARGRR